MHLLNALAVAVLSTTATVDISSNCKNTDVIDSDVIYESPEEFEETLENENGDSTFALPGYTPVAPDTTSFSDAYPLAGDEFYYAEEFGASDTYDFVKYTATYTRNIYLNISTSNNCYAYVTVYNSREGFNYVYADYTANNNDDLYAYIPVRQGETVYFKIRCAQTCTWEGILDLEFVLSGRCYYDYDNLHGYDLPHTGPAEIPYRFHNSVNAYVPGQNYTFREVFLEAMDIWEACGNITFVENIWTKNYKIEVSDITDIEVGVDETLLGEIYFTHCRVPSYSHVYEAISSGLINPDGTQVSIRQAVLGVCLQALGRYLGLGRVDISSYFNNIMYYDPMPYYYLGDGDIASFMYLWGDANRN